MLFLFIIRRLNPRVPSHRRGQRDSRRAGPARTGGDRRVLAAHPRHHHHRGRRRLLRRGLRGAAQRPKRPRRSPLRPATARRSTVSPSRIAKMSGMHSSPSRWVWATLTGYYRSARPARRGGRRSRHDHRGRGLRALLQPVLVCSSGTPRSWSASWPAIGEWAMAAVWAVGGVRPGA